MEAAFSTPNGTATTTASPIPQQQLSSALIVVHSGTEGGQPALAGLMGVRRPATEKYLHSRHVRDESCRATEDGP